MPKGGTTADELQKVQTEIPATLFGRLVESKEFIFRLIIGVFLLLIFQPIIGLELKKSKEADWQILFWYGFVLILFTQISWYPGQFFTGAGSGLGDIFKYFIFGTPLVPEDSAEQNNPEDVSFWRLMPSAFITWIFAKSIRNAAVLGAAFGILGGFAYATYYLAFPAAAIVCYYLRTRNNAGSLPGAIQHCYGSFAQILFCLGLLYRLQNEVWSNSIVVASFYGEYHSSPWWWAIFFSTFIPMVYVLMGGMRSSLISDTVQAFLGFLFLFIVLGYIGDDEDFNLSSYRPKNGWAKGGWNLFYVGLLQGVVSYPWHDPVLTDRCFLATPKVMLQSFVVGGLLSGVFIVSFSFIGIYGQFLVSEDNPNAGASSSNGEPSTVGRALGSAVFSFINFIMMTSSMSTLDSTFTSTAKLFALDLGGWLNIDQSDNRPSQEKGPLTIKDMEYVGQNHMRLGRIAIFTIAFFGTLPLVEQSDALDATLISGTTVMGLGPPVYLMIFWQFSEDGSNEKGWRRSPLCFIFSFLTGVVYGALYQIDAERDNIDLSDDLLWGVHFPEGSYQVLLGANVWGHLCCLLAAILGFLLDQYVIPVSSNWNPFIKKPSLNNNQEKQSRMKSVSQGEFEAQTSPHSAQDDAVDIDVGGFNGKKNNVTSESEMGITNDAPPSYDDIDNEY